ncbi:hypothetical protein [Methanothermobacter sp. K4]|uniref:hypothetical protein n=1 Tax=Methanothermobacter sp. K4 TaxID=2913262 RepID=UPI001EDB3C49|nr:hypothetical protein [Methanothermobacter sp. K4]MCG2827745.1 hypothetical protein [Methanothermobacter sp. K4]
MINVSWKINDQELLVSQVTENWDSLVFTLVVHAESDEYKDLLMQVKAISDMAVADGEVHRLIDGKTKVTFTGGETVTITDGIREWTGVILKPQYNLDHYPIIVVSVTVLVEAPPSFLEIVDGMYFDYDYFDGEYFE